MEEWPFRCRISLEIPYFPKQMARLFHNDVPNNAIIKSVLGHHTHVYMMSGYVDRCTWDLTSLGAMMNDKMSDFSGGTASPGTLSIINRVSPEGTALTLPLFQPEDATAEAAIIFPATQERTRWLGYIYIWAVNHTRAFVGAKKKNGVCAGHGRLVLCHCRTTGLLENKLTAAATVSLWQNQLMACDYHDRIRIWIWERTVPNCIFIFRVKRAKSKIEPRHSPWMTRQPSKAKGRGAFVANFLCSLLSQCALSSTPHTTSTSPPSSPVRSLLSFPPRASAPEPNQSSKSKTASQHSKSQGRP